MPTQLFERSRKGEHALLIQPHAGGPPDDGLLDILIFKNLGYLDIARYLGGVLLGKHTELSDVTYFQAPAAKIHSTEDVPIEVDGELSGVLPANVRVTGKLRIFVP